MNCGEICISCYSRERKRKRERKRESIHNPSDWSKWSHCVQCLDDGADMGDFFGKKCHCRLEIWLFTCVCMCVYVCACARVCLCKRMRETTKVTEPEAKVETGKETETKTAKQSERASERATEARVQELREGLREGWCQQASGQEKERT